MCAITADVFEVVGLFFYVMKIFPGNALIMDLASIGSCIASFILLQPPHSTDEFDVFTTDFNAPDFVKKSTLIGLSAAVLYVLPALVLHLLFTFYCLFLLCSSVVFTANLCTLVRSASSP